jgi:hypothetical protein
MAIPFSKYPKKPAISYNAVFKAGLRLYHRYWVQAVLSSCHLCIPYVLISSWAIVTRSVKIEKRTNGLGILPKVVSGLVYGTFAMNMPPKETGYQPIRVIFLALVYTIVQSSGMIIVSFTYKTRAFRTMEIIEERQRCYSIFIP